MINLRRMWKGVGLTGSILESDSRYPLELPPPAQPFQLPCSFLTSQMGIIASGPLWHQIHDKQLTEQTQRDLAKF